MSAVPLIVSPPPRPPRDRPSPSARRDLRVSLVDAAAYAVMVGVGETYVPAFVLALGLGEVKAGLVASVPMLAGAVLQLATPFAVRALGSRRRWVMTCATLQALCFAPYVVGALLGRLSAPLVFAIATAYWAFGQGTGPAWNTWIEGVVPRRVRARYFAGRNRLAQAATFTAFIAGGLLLQAGAPQGEALLAFAAAFTLAMAARLVSVRALAAQSEPDGLWVERRVPVARFAARLVAGEDGRLVLYMMAMQAAVYVAAPYFNPFMLSELRLSYVAYGGLMATAYAARIVALPLLGAWARRYGARPVLWLGGVGVVPMSLVWVFSSHYVYLVAAQAVAGVVWAAYELATQLLFFEMIRREERTSVLTYYNLTNAAAIVTGALVGGALMSAVGGRAGYFAAFILSFVGRGLTVLLLRGVGPAPRRLTRLLTRLRGALPFAEAGAQASRSRVTGSPPGLARGSCRDGRSA